MRLRDGDRQLERAVGGLDLRRQITRRKHRTLKGLVVSLGLVGLGGRRRATRRELRGVGLRGGLRLLTRGLRRVGRSLLGCLRSEVARLLAIIRHR